MAGGHDARFSFDRDVATDLPKRAAGEGGRRVTRMHGDRQAKSPPGVSRATAASAALAVEATVAPGGLVLSLPAAAGGMDMHIFIGPVSRAADKGAVAQLGPAGGEKGAIGPNRGVAPHRAARPG